MTGDIQQTVSQMLCAAAFLVRDAGEMLESIKNLTHAFDYFKYFTDKIFPPEELQKLHCDLDQLQDRILDFRSGGDERLKKFWQEREDAIHNDLTTPAGPVKSRTTKKTKEKNNEHTNHT